jgi:heparan-alpha-glucosaminide N-acetyltransferase
MAEKNRIYSIDIMRGITLILMLFVNDLYMPGVPAWLGHRAGDFDGMGLADWVFPGFLFMVGMAVPFALGNRIAKGESSFSLSKHILIRTASLLIIGVLMANSRRVNGEFTGLSKSLWSLIMYSGVFLIWNSYEVTEKNTWLMRALRIAGIIMIVSMVYIFRSGDQGTNHLSFTSWGILGTIGWGYLAASFVYLAVRDNILKSAVAMLFFLALNVLSKLHMLDFLNVVRPAFGVLINGNAPFIVMSGLFVTLILRKLSKEDAGKALLIIGAIGAVSILAGFILRNWFIISKIQSTPSWGLLCNGISMLLFALLFWIIDIKKQISWGRFFKPAGANSLTVYLVPDMFYYIIWQFSLPVLFYKNSDLPPLVVVAGSLAWALVMGMALPVLLERLNFRLKL